MNNPDFDVAIAGGGLAGSLTEVILQNKCPELRIALIDSGKRTNHTWSFHASDLSAGAYSLLSPLISSCWKGYGVRFPDHSRHLDLTYCSIRSEDFWKRIDLLSKGVVRIIGQVTEIGTDKIILADSARISGNAVLDARGIDPDQSYGMTGWQKFIGFEIHTTDDHDIIEPIIMDATVDQYDGFRFFYVLPFSRNQLLIEDTYYSDHKNLDKDRIEKEIVKYIRSLGIENFEIRSKEFGALPIPLSADYLARHPGVPAIGMRGGFFHPTTGYSLPHVVLCAETLAHQLATYQLVSDEFAKQIEHSVAQTQRQIAKSAEFLIRLNRMLFCAAVPNDRWRVLSRFYRKKLTVISDFYSGRLCLTTKMAMISGVPPVPVLRGIKHFIGPSSGKPLV